MKIEKINEIKEIEKNRLEKEKKVSDSSEENPNEDSANMEVQKNEKINEEVLAQIPNETEEVSNVKENQIEKEKVIEKSKNRKNALPK